MFHALRFMIIGHQFQWKFLKKTFELGEIPHAYLFCGPNQIGKMKIAVEFTKLLFGSESFQSIEKGIHPDLVLIKPLPAQTHPQFGDGIAESKENLIKISQIRELNSYFSLRPYSAPFKVAIIDEAHCMNSEAQSSFLKLLEEPRGKTIFILITPFPKMLLPTILSRTQTVKFYRVLDSEIKKYLQSQKIAEKTANEIIEFSGGKPGRAINFLSDPQKLEKEREKLQEIIKLTNSDLAFRFQCAENLSKTPKNLSEILDLWQRYFRKLLLARLNFPKKNLGGFSKIKITPGDQFPHHNFSTGAEARYSLSKLKNILNLIQKINFLISTTNVKPRLALEILMLEL